MNYKNIIKKGIALGLLSCIVLFSSCTKEEENEVVLFEKGEINASADVTSIKAGESVTFTDNSTKAYTREWTFPGGDPETAVGQMVTVVYAAGGEFGAKLKVNFVDNTFAEQTINISVEGEALPDNPQPTFTESYGIYTEYDQVTPGAEIFFEKNSALDPTVSYVSSYEGTENMAFLNDGTIDWAMAGIKPVSGPIDVSNFSDGYYNFSIKSTSEADILIRFQSSGQKAILEFTATNELYGFKRDGEWHLIQVPMADFLTLNPSLDFSAITDFMVLRSSGGDIRTANNYDFYIDNFFLSK